VFLSGTIVGALGHRYYYLHSVRAGAPPQRSPEDYRKSYMSEMKSRLNLSPEQAAGIEKILDLTRDRFRDLREKYRPEMKQIQDEQVAQITALLRPDQQGEYARLRKEREERRKAAEAKNKGRTP
jgi:hypothetical protein